MTFGAPHRHFKVTDSTNARARELVEAGAPGGTVVSAREQTAGRGRRGRVWTAPEGKALLYSAILRPLDERHLLLPLSVPLAVCVAAEALRPGSECQVKWPNDVWLEGSKLAGILIEARFPSEDSASVTGERRTKRGKDAGRPNSSAIRPTGDAAARSVRRRQARAGSPLTGTQLPQEGWAVIGVGLNLSIEQDEFPDDLRQPAISLGGGITPEEARRELDAQLGRWVDADEAEVLTEWRRRDGLRGREVSWEEGSGVADGIDDRGNLVVVVPGGNRISLGAGEVQLRL
jgi:BirA family transcriptional regulator, biotin operon repressor / biotin---[acetyl-CoA-carboxylase] ligase